MHRFQAFYVPNGMAMEYWTPKGEGSDFELSPILEPLAPYRDQMLVLSGIKASWNYIHAGASGSFLTGTTRGGRNEVEIIADVSMDQLLGEALRQGNAGGVARTVDGPAGQRGRLHRQSELRLHAHALLAQPHAAAADGVESASGVREAVWRQRQHGSRPRAKRGLRQHKSILDSVTGEAGGVSRRNSGRRIRSRSTNTPTRFATSSAAFRWPRSRATSNCRRMEQPQGAPPVFEDHLALMLDLQVLAFQSDLTRVISFMLSKEQSARPYPQIGVPEAHHPLSHHNNIPELIEQMSKINRYHAQLFSQYLAKLRATPDGDGSLLDHMTILYGAGISNSTRHSGDNLPLLLVGGGAGRLKGGRHLKYADKPSMANLLVTLMDKMDVPVEQARRQHRQTSASIRSPGCRGSAMR